MRYRPRTERRLPPVVPIVCVIATVAWCAYATSAIAPFNAMPSRTGNVRLPISSLPMLPVMQLEFARGAEDVKAILEVGRASESKNVNDVREGNELDSWYLIPGYTLLLIALSLLVAQDGRHVSVGLFMIGVTVALAIAAADFTENYGIGQILDAPADAVLANQTAPLVSAAAFVKWTLLGLLLIYLAVVASLPQNWRRWLSPVLLIAGILLLAVVGRHAVDRFLT